MRSNIPSDLNFRSAMDKAGLRFTIDCPDLPEAIYVDPEMWEKMVLNLLSNAFKHTFRSQLPFRDGQSWITVHYRLSGPSRGDLRGPGNVGENGLEPSLQCVQTYLQISTSVPRWTKLDYGSLSIVRTFPRRSTWTRKCGRKWS